MLLLQVLGILTEYRHQGRNNRSNLIKSVAEVCGKGGSILPAAIFCYPLIANGPEIKEQGNEGPVALHWHGRVTTQLHPSKGIFLC